MKALLLNDLGRRAFYYKICFAHIHFCNLVEYSPCETNSLHPSLPFSVHIYSLVLLIFCSHTYSHTNRIINPHGNPHSFANRYAHLPTATPIPAPERAKYTLNTTIDYDAHTVTVDETILYPNHTGNQLNTLVIAIVPNLWEGSFTLTSISIDGTPTTTYSIDGQRLDIALSSFFKPEEVMTINIQYSLSLPFAEQEDPSVSRPRIYGYTKRQLNLTNWYPFVVPYINGEWVLHEPWYYGEHLVYDAADYEVNLKFTDPATAPIVAASGVPEPAGRLHPLHHHLCADVCAFRQPRVSSLQFTSWGCDCLQLLFPF